MSLNRSRRLENNSYYRLVSRTILVNFNQKHQISHLVAISLKSIYIEYNIKSVNFDLLSTKYSGDLAMNPITERILS